MTKKEAKAAAKAAKAAETLARQEKQSAYKANVHELVESGYYTRQQTADRFFLQHMAVAWRSKLAWDGSDIDLLSDLSPTLRRVFHLMGRVVHRVGCGKRGDIPAMRAWPPQKRIVDQRGNPVCFRGIATPDIALITGASVSAVSSALRRVKGDEADGLYAKRLAVVISNPAGITIDGAFEAQMRFGFDYSEYQQAIQVSRDWQVDAATRHRQQREWCAEKSRELTKSLPLLERTAEVIQIDKAS
jgi:hypothetical protein